MTNTEALQRAITVVGGQAQLARELKQRTQRPIRQGHIWSWLHRTKRVPPDLAPHIELITRECGEAVTRETLCPDFPWTIQGTQG